MYDAKMNNIQVDSSKDPKWSFIDEGTPILQGGKVFKYRYDDIDHSLDRKNYCIGILKPR